MTLLDRVLGPADPDHQVVAAALAWPLFFAAGGRFAYGVDAWIHGSPQMTLLGGPAFSNVWSGVSAAAALLTVAGLIICTRTGRARLELIGCAACCALSVGFAVGVGYNVIAPNDQQSLVPAWQPLALGAIAGWRAHRIGRAPSRTEEAPA